jgi:hypothetical protein
MREFPRSFKTHLFKKCQPASPSHPAAASVYPKCISLCGVITFSSFEPYPPRTKSRPPLSPVDPYIGGLLRSWNTDVVWHTPRRAVPSWGRVGSGVAVPLVPAELRSVAWLLAS